MKKRYCPECEISRDVCEETVEGKEYLCCTKCGTIIAEINFDWELPPLDSDADTV